jgi:hypothetical protein
VGAPTTIYLKYVSGTLNTCGSVGVNITLGAASKLAFVGTPPPGFATVPIAPTFQVQVQDAASNVVSSASNSVTLSISSGTGTISGTVSAAAVNGVVDFSNVVISATGAKILAANSGGLTSANSPSFNILTGTPNKVAASIKSSCAVRSNGNTYCWGDNSTYALGIGQGSVSSYDQAATVVPSSGTQTTLTLNSVVSFGGAAHAVDGGNG